MSPLTASSSTIGVDMSVLTGPQRGTVRLYLPPEGRDEEFMQGLVQAIWQLDHVASVDVEGRMVVVKNDLVSSLKGQALAEIIADFDDEVNAVLQGMLALLKANATREAARQVQFSHR